MKYVATFTRDLGTGLRNRPHDMHYIVKASSPGAARKRALRFEGTELAAGESLGALRDIRIASRPEVRDLQPIAILDPAHNPASHGPILEH